MGYVVVHGEDVFDCETMDALLEEGERFALCANVPYLKIDMWGTRTRRSLSLRGTRIRVGHAGGFIGCTFEIWRLV